MRRNVTRFKWEHARYSAPEWGNRGKGDLARIDCDPGTPTTPSDIRFTRESDQNGRSGAHRGKAPRYPKHLRNLENKPYSDGCGRAREN